MNKNKCYNIFYKLNIYCIVNKLDNLHSSKHTLNEKCYTEDIFKLPIPKKILKYSTYNVEKYVKRFIKHSVRDE